MTSSNWKMILAGATLVVLTTLTAGCGGAGDEEPPAATAADAPSGGSDGVAAEAAEPEAEPLFDGPHIFWSDDSMAYVGSVCDGDAVFDTAQGEPGRNLRIADPCFPDRIYEVDPTPPEPEPSAFEAGGRVFAVSDVEGNFDELLLLLHHAGVVDDEYRWAWGDGRLVFAGDMVDRGDQVTQELWWVHQLEPQARAAGGRVHVVLGNHDAMIMYNDIRYTHEKYQEVAQALRTSVSGLYGPSTEMGRWLRSKPAMIRLGDVLFLHGGVSSVLAEQGLDIDEVNAAIRQGIQEPWRTRALPLEEMLFGSDGPLWYRGYFRDEELQDGAIAQALDAFGARTVVVGHTRVDDIEALHGGLVYGVNVFFTDADELQGLLIEDGEFYRVDVGAEAPVRIGPVRRP